MATSAHLLRRVALVTGAAQGIGRSIALRLAKDGLNVAVIDLPSRRQQLDNVVAEITNGDTSGPGPQALALTADVSSESDVQAMVASTVERLGGLDVMVANAGISLFSELVDTSIEQWDKVMNVNLKGVMLSYKYAALQMILQGRGGRIIGASSTGGKRGYVTCSAYCATKFGVRGLTQSAALELAKYNITVNAYAPGAIKTDMLITPQDAESSSPGATVMQGIGIPADAPPPAEPEVVASLVSYLAKPESHFITGQAISMNGGTHFD